jgi:hypothetical protein
LWYRDHEDLVEYGIARLIGEGEVIVEEPMALMSIVRYFETQDLSLEYELRVRMQWEKGHAFEDAVLLSCTTTFRDGARQMKYSNFTRSRRNGLAKLPVLPSRTTMIPTRHSTLSAELPWYHLRELPFLLTVPRMHYPGSRRSRLGGTVLDDTWAQTSWLGCKSQMGG